jgi:hypothetical protein
MLRSTLLAALAFSLIALSGCDSQQGALREAQMAGTPEAYEAFLAQYPDSTYAASVRESVEDLRYSNAKNGTESALWREYLEQHPQGKYVKQARKMEDEVSFHEADAARTPVSYQTYLDSHPSGEFVKTARGEMDELAYLENVFIDNYRVERLNLARDPKGPLNGWGFYADVHNNGDRIIIEVQVELQFLDETGKVLDTRMWWAVAPQLMGMPTPARIIPPLRPEALREFEFTTGEPPEGWKDAFKLEIMNLRFREKK